MKHLTILCACIAVCGVLVTGTPAATNTSTRYFGIEGPVAQNLYSGTVTLDGKGEAMVALPPDFDASNVNPQYVLTPVGAAMPNLHVMQKIHDNRFWIAGGAPAGEVSWMVVAQRNDPACVQDLKNHTVEQINNSLKPGQTAAENQSVTTTTVSP